MSNQPTGPLDVTAIRADFPVLDQEILPGVPLVYLDNAATSQKPRVVIDAISAYYQQDNANVHRGIHSLAERATASYEGARAKIAAFIGAGSVQEVVFVRNTTEGINLVANSWGRANIGPGDEIVLTELEHHSNLVPWQLLAQEKGATIRYVLVNKDCRLDMEQYVSFLSERTKLVAFTGMSNVLGTFTPAKEMIRQAHAVGALALVDGAQLVPHAPVNVVDLDADFMAFSAHKMCGPMGMGVLYGKREILQEMPPFLGGGDMIRRVTLEGSEWNDLPWKFEAGTPSVGEAIGLGAAVDYLSKVGMDAIKRYEHEIANYALEALSELRGVKTLGPPAADRGAAIAFTVAGMHPHDVAELLNREGVAVRAGHHCAMPLHQKLGLPATTRASFYLYNTFDEVDRLVEALFKAQKLFGVG
jgi:cysteine desulfurase/selenocysteine lyase